MKIDSAIINVQASGSVGSSISGSSQPTWRNVLPNFLRDIDPDTVDSAWAGRLTVVGAVDEYIFGSFPAVEKNGDPIIADDGAPLQMAVMALLVVRAGKIDTEEEAAGTITINCTDLFGTLEREVKDGDTVLQELPAFALLSSSELKIKFSTGSENLCADVLFLGAASVPIPT